MMSKCVQACCWNRRLASGWKCCSGCSGMLLLGGPGLVTLGTAMLMMPPRAWRTGFVAYGLAPCCLIFGLVLACMIQCCGTIRLESPRATNRKEERKRVTLVGP